MTSRDLSQSAEKATASPLTRDADEKTATLTVKLVADSGDRRKVKVRVSPVQWGMIVAAIEGKQ